MRLNSIREDMFDDDDDMDYMDDSNAYGEEDFEPDDQVKTVDLKKLTPAFIWENPELYTYSVAFLFVPPRTMLMAQDATHADIGSHLANQVKSNPRASTVEKTFAKHILGITHYGKMPPFPFVHGRIANNLEIAGYEGRDLLSIWVNDSSSKAVIVQCIQSLLAKGQIDQETIVVAGSQVYTVGDPNGVQEQSPEEIRRAKLQIALHLGATEDGQRLTAQQKQSIKKELGLAGYHSTNPWERAGEKAGVRVPGQKMWAMNSESKNAPFHG